MTGADSNFTASQYARALRRPVRSIRRLLDAIPEDGQTAAGGNVAKTWGICRLPARLQNELTLAAAHKGYRNAEAMLREPPKIWTSPVPLGKLPQTVLEKACKWRAALKETWERANDPGVSVSELARQGMADFQRVFGYTISERQWRTVYERALERDNGFGDWERVELYLDESARTVDAPANQAAALLEFADLEQMMNRWPNRANPSAALARLLWIRAFEVFEDKVSQGRSAKAVRKAMIRYLLERAPFLSKSEAGLRTNWQKKYGRWVKGDRHALELVDKRAASSGHKRGPKNPDGSAWTDEQWKPEADKLIAYAVARTGGRLAQAWREMTSGRSDIPEELRFNSNLLGYFLANPASKSYVPKRMIRLAATDIRILNKLHKSKRDHDLNGAHLLLDWTPSFANQAHCADDTTLPVYFYERNPDGTCTLMRGQALVLIDMRSLRVLALTLIAKRNYDSFAVHSLYTIAWDEHGVPEVVVHEGGLWDKARLLKGKQVGALPGDEIELGLREFGIQFRHARRARAKTVERVIGALQSWMEREPGYCGRDEIRDRHEEFQKLKLEIEAGRETPEGKIYSRDQWERRLVEIVEAYNATPQDGDILRGLSPDEAFEKFRNPSNPPTRFDARCRYLLALYKRPVKVTRNGVTIRIGKEVFNYHDAETGKIIGEQVIAWFNPQAPEFLTITDMEKRNPRCIERSKRVPALGAPKEIIEIEQQKVAAHQGYAKERYRVLKTKFKPVFRTNIVDAPTVALGKEIESREVAKRQEKRVEQRNRREAASLGVRVPADRMGKEDTSERLRRFKTALEEAKEEASEQEGI